MLQKALISTKTSKEGSNQLTINTDNETKADNPTNKSHLNRCFTLIARKNYKAKKTLILSCQKSKQKHSFCLPPESQIH